MNTPLTDAEALAYLASYADLRTLGADAEAGRRHYEAFGQAEGRTISFSGLLYTAANPDLIVAFGTDSVAATRHFIQYGAAENRPVRFDALEYIASNPDLILAVGADEAAGAEHYILYGKTEGRPTASFDALTYTAANPDLIAAFGTDARAATEHYVLYGAAEQRPADFDPVAYLLSQPDLRAAGLGADGALAHWINYGFAEGRSGDSTFGREQTDHTLTVGQTVYSSIDGAADRDWFRIDVKQGQQVKIAITLADGASRPPALHLYDASGYEVPTTTTITGGIATTAFTAGTAGALYLTTDATVGYEGAYSLQASTYLIQQGGTSGSDYLPGTNGDDLLQGLGSRDVLDGFGGNDVLEGGAGGDDLYGGQGDDVLYGNNSLNDNTSGGVDGRDYLGDWEGGNDRLYGQDDADTLIVTRDGDMAASTVLLDGGSGDDSISFYSSRYVDTVRIEGGTGDDGIYVGGVLQSLVDAGEGNDRVTITLTGGSQTIALGLGADVLTLDRTFAAVPTSALVTDFVVGTDRLSFGALLLDALQGWDSGSNPFAGGYLQLVQFGTDTLLQIDRDGGGDAFATLLTFNDTTASSFTLGDLGYAPDGSIKGETIIGTFGRDTLTGKNGDDLLQGLDGSDVLEGRGGDDVLEGGQGSDRLNGGSGNDILYGNDAANSGAYDGGFDTLRV